MQVCIAPTDIHQNEVKKLISHKINIMANVSQHPDGYYTGNTKYYSPEMLRDMGVTWTLIGDSERRAHSEKTDEDIAWQTKSALEQDMTVMVCIGEQKNDELEEGKSPHRINARQLRAIADHIHPKQWERVVIVYEPEQCIGTGCAASVEEVQESHFYIR